MVIKKPIFNIKPLDGSGKKLTKNNPFYEADFPNVIALGKRKSGKSTVIYNIIKELMKDKRFFLVIFSKNAYHDPVYLKLAKDYPNTRIWMSANVKDDFEQMTEVLKNNQDPKQFFICVLDDVSKDLRNKDLAYHYLISRNQKCVNLIGAHFLKNIDPSTRGNIDVYLLFKNQLRALEELIEELDIHFDPDLLKQAYLHSTKEDHGFCTIDLEAGTVRNGFGKTFKIF